MITGHTTNPASVVGRISHARQQRGFALIIGLLMLMIVALLGVSMLRSISLQERIAGNTREKQRAMQAAQSALQYGEWWLKQGNAGTGSACSGVINANSISAMQACSNPLSSPTDPTQWTARADYLPPAMVVNAGGGTTVNGNGDTDINYQKLPSFYIYYLGLSPDGHSMLYQLTAAGYGGSSSSVAVVQSVYAIKSGVTDLGGP